MAEDTKEQVTVEEVKGKKKKKTWEENECPKGRWVWAAILALLVGAITGGILMYWIMPIISAIFPGHESLMNFVGQLAAFICNFWFLLLFIKAICKTSAWSFILGKDRHNEKKAMWIVFGLHTLGMLLSMLPDAAVTYVNPNATVGGTITLLLVSGLLIWMQAGFEELFFRGIIGRLFFGDNLKQKFSGKVFAYIAVSSILFMAGHFINPEITSTSGIDTFFMALTYLLSGVMFAILTVQFGSLLPGIIVHTVNNWIDSWLISDEVSVLGTQTIFVNGNKVHEGIMSFITVLVTFIPVIIFMIVRNVKAKKAAQE